MRIKGEVHPKMITSNLVVFRALSRMVKVRGACEKPFRIYERLNNCTAPAPDCDDVLVVEEEAFYVRGIPRKLPLKRHHCPARGGAKSLIYPTWHIACTTDLHHLTPHPEHYEIWGHFWVNFPFKRVDRFTTHYGVSESPQGYKLTDLHHTMLQRNKHTWTRHTSCRWPPIPTPGNNMPSYE